LLPGLKVASPEMQADREVVKAALHKYGYALRVASEELRADKELVLLRVTHAVDHM